MGALQNIPVWSLKTVQPAEHLKKSEFLPSGIEALDRFLGGGLPVGALTEWGMPLGLGGREMLVPWIRQMTHAAPPQWTLWIHAHHDLDVYPPAWAARGVVLEKMRFARTSAPLKDLRPIFLEPLFKLIIIDSHQSFTGEEYAFIARQARRLRQVVIVLRQEVLCTPVKKDVFSKIRKFPKGKRRYDEHIWSRLRLNLWNDEPPFFRGSSASYSENGLGFLPAESGVDELRGETGQGVLGLRGGAQDERELLGERERFLWLEVVRGLSPRCLKLSSKSLISL